MQQATITISQLQDEKVGIVIDFQPPLTPESVKNNAAVNIASAVAEFLAEKFNTPFKPQPTETPNGI